MISCRVGESVRPMRMRTLPGREAIRSATWGEARQIGVSHGDVHAMGRSVGLGQHGVQMLGEPWGTASVEDGHGGSRFFNGEDTVPSLLYRKYNHL